ncbi:MAG: hypothetical protein EOO62_08450 [Hymenobacter sp.]|nr:MAG: hypothetical protein EOO62_08450 [Hymenobacter sp.]
MGQAAYVGTVGAAPIELALNSVSEDPLAGTYIYAKIGTPIKLTGQLKQGVLTLTEPDVHGKPAATFTVPGFAAGATQLTGTWRSLATGRQLPVVLTQRTAVTPGKATAGQGREVLQAESLPNCYFRTVLAKGGEDYYATVSGVQVVEKKTNRVLQYLPLDGQSRGIYSVSTGDFNFDGLPDFSVFESSYAGPNTSSLYYLYDPAKKRYVASGYGGTSLEFDTKKRRVYEHNSCCAGSSVTKVEYKVVNNKLVILARHCYRWDEKKQELVERPFSACQ